MNDIARAAEHWNTAPARPAPRRSRWWESPAICRHINKKVCGEAMDGMHSGFHKKLAARLESTQAKGVSIGCGSGAKELSLVRAGIVGEFDLFEISEQRIELGRTQAEAAGLADRVRFHHVTTPLPDLDGAKFDVVYWNNALHHMLDTRAAVIWSRDHLAENGWFAMDDFVGPSRFQWTDRALKFANDLRAAVSDSNPAAARFPAAVRPTLARMIEVDPSEAADSDSILPAIREIFPAPEIIGTGGAIYHTALNDVLVSLGENSAELRAALVLDDALSEMGENHYAVAFARAG